MPFPWKKARVGRISRFVADLQSPQRGGSLVVQTGFPTSLIDLFVKNRDRLKKPRKRRSNASDPLPYQSPLSPHSLERQRPFESVQHVQSQTSLHSFSEIRGVECGEEEIGGVDGGGGGGGGSEVEENIGEPSGRGVIMAFLKMSVVVILALGTKKLAVGITMSAFFLLFLEYAAKWVFRFLRPCSHAQIAIKSLIQSVFPFLMPGKKLLNPSQPHTPKALSNSCIEEIQTLESQFDFLPPMAQTREIQETPMMPNVEIREIRTGKPEIKIPALERRSGFREVKERERNKEKAEEIIQVLEVNNCRNRGARLKAKIKKFVPKKIRAGRGGSNGREKERGPDSSSELSTSVAADKLSTFEEEEDEEEGENGEVQEQDDEDKSFSWPWPTVEESEEGSSEQQDMNGSICSSVPELQNEVASVIGKEKKDIVGNSGYLVLFLIVLTGLIGGRVLALLLTTAWCLMLKLIKKRITPLT